MNEETRDILYEQREALQELVRLKKIKNQMDVLGEFPVASPQATQYFILKEQYEAAKEGAWAKAFEAVGEQP